MYGFVGNYAGLDQGSLKGAADNPKITSGVSFYDHAAYDLGFVIKNLLNGRFRHSGADASVSVSAFCSALNSAVKKNPWALFEERAGGGYNDYSHCQSCGKKTKLTTHGGSGGETLIP